MVGALAGVSVRHRDQRPLGRQLREAEPEVDDHAVEDRGHLTAAAAEARPQTVPPAR